MSPDEQIYWGHRMIGKDGAVYWLHASPDRRWVGLFGFAEPIVCLKIRERTKSDPESKYWGWLDSPESDLHRVDRYVLVWPSKHQLEMCFPYGSKAEENHNCGRAVNLIVEEIPDEKDSNHH